MKRYILFGVILSTIFLSCDLSNPIPIDVPEPSASPIETKVFEQQTDGSYLLETNDKKYITTKGKAFITYADSPIENGEFSYTVTVQKNSGDLNGGFGLVFQRTSETNLWFFEIDVSGYFCLGKYVDGDIWFVFNPPWKESKKAIIHDKYGTPNTLKVVFNGNADYEIFANGNSVVSFTDSSFGKVLRGGSFGVMADVMPSERFPDTPVSVLFNIPANMTFPQSSRLPSLTRSLGVYK